MRRSFVCIAFAAGTSLATAAWAIAPGQTGELPQSGQWSGDNWSLQTAGVYQWNTTWNSNWYVGSAVAVAPNYLLTAGHVNGNTTDYATINGERYSAVESFTPPADPGFTGSPDLRLIKVDKALPVYNELFTGLVASTTPVTLIGYGQTGEDNAWASVIWTAGTEGVQRWGTNKVASTAQRLNSGGYSSSAFSVAYLKNDTPYEALAAGGDSGGGIFIKNNDTWQLAGIITNSGTMNTWAVSIPVYADWIQSVTQIPEPSALATLTMLVMLVRRRKAQR